MSSPRTTDEITQALRALPAPPVGLELQWKLHGDDDQPYWMLSLHGILELPGWYHSVYSTAEVSRWPAETLEQRHHAHREAQAVAARVNLRLHAPPVENRGGQGDSAWLRAQPPGREHAYPVQWEIEWWTDDGHPREDRGTELVTALSGEAACMAHAKVLSSRHATTYHCYRLCMTGCDDARLGWSGRIPANDPALQREAVCAIAFSEREIPSRIAHALVARAPHASTFQLMLAFYDAFDVTLESLDVLVRWRSGEVADASLDAALTEAIAHSRLRWDGARQLREVRSAGRSVAAHVRELLLAGADSIVLDDVLFHAFGLKGMDSKAFVIMCTRNLIERADTMIERSIPRTTTEP